MRRVGLAALALAAIFLHACATKPLETAQAPDLEAPAPAPSRVETPKATPDEPPRVRPAVDYVRPDDMPGWAQEDHAAALAAWRQSCGLNPDLIAQEVCRQARALGPVDDDAARIFLEDHFRVDPLPGSGILTAYFAPRYEAREAPGGEFTAPVRPAPRDLKPGRAYPDRAAIEARPPNDALAWMRPEDLFFLQVQGSGVLVFPDGHREKALFAAHNDRTFVGIANPMRDRGLLPANNTSGDAIRKWLADNRGPRANAIMRLNPRYVFFRLEPDDGADPAGAAGLPLPAGHAVAVDPAYHQMGEFLWIDAAAPILAGAFPAYQRAVVALDTGGAIKGDIRADLYLGKGDDAGREAGRVRHDLRMYRLTPVEPPAVVSQTRP